MQHKYSKKEQAYSTKLFPCLFKTCLCERIGGARNCESAWFMWGQQIEIICLRVIEGELHNITHQQCKGFISRDLTHLNRKEASSGVVNGHFGSIHFHFHFHYSYSIISRICILLCPFLGPQRSRDNFHKFSAGKIFSVAGRHEFWASSKYFVRLCTHRVQITPSQISRFWEEQCLSNSSGFVVFLSLATLIEAKLYEFPLH